MTHTAGYPMIYWMEAAQQPRGKVILLGLLKKVQMQGFRNPEE